MSENSRKRQLENYLSMIRNKRAYDYDDDSYESVDYTKIDDHYDEDENHQEESENDCDDDDNDDCRNHDPWNVCDVDDKNEDHDDCQLQRAIKEDHPVNSILELMKLFPMQAKHKNELGEYPLHTACSSKINVHNVVVMKLIELYPKAVRHKNSSGLYPIHLAFHSIKSDAVLIKLIEVFPKPIRKSSTNGNALHFALKKYYLSERLLKKLIEINPTLIQEQDCRGRCPIYYAINGKHSVAVTKILLDADTLRMQRVAECHANDETIFFLACDSDNVDLVRYLMRRSDFQINGRDRSGRTPLHSACSYCRLPNEDRYQIVDMILNHPDVDVNATNSLGDTPLHTVLKYYDRYCHNRNPERLLSVVQKLLVHELILINEKNNHNKTPLDLINDRANILENSKQELTPLQQDYLSCFMKIIHLLKELLAKRRWQEYCYYIKNFTTDSCE